MKLGVMAALFAGRKLEDPFTAREYRKRSLSPQALGALVEGLHLAGAQLVNLQVGPDRDAAAPLACRFAEALPEQAAVPVPPAGEVAKPVAIKH